MKLATAPDGSEMSPHANGETRAPNSVYALALGSVGVVYGDIGNAATPLTERMTQGVLQADLHMAPEPRMNVDHVGEAVVYMASLPLDANVLFMTVMATKMPFVGRG